MWGGIITLLCSTLALAGHAVDADTQSFLASTITQIASSIGTTVGGFIAIWGRMKATKAIG